MVQGVNELLTIRSIEPPDAPTDIKVSERDGRSVRLVWATPYSGNSPLTHYVLQHKLENGECGLLGIHFAF